MKIRPVILCGGSGTRLWPNQQTHQAKQFINFGGWTLLEKTLKRIKKPIFDHPILSTNYKYLKQLKSHLKKAEIKTYKIILEPIKKNTAPAILISALLNDNQLKQPLLFLSSDHLIEKTEVFNKELKKNKKYLSDRNIFIFGIKPTFPSTEYGYFFTKKVKNNIREVDRFIEKPKLSKAFKIIKKKAYWNSGMFFIRKDSLIKNFVKYNPKIYRSCVKTLSSKSRTKFKKKIYYLDKKLFNKVPSKSFDRAILEKANKINAIILNISWSDLGSWNEISKIYNRNKAYYFNKKNIYYRPWGSYVNLFKGKNFLVKELTINSKSSISLQKHFHRSEHWLISQGKPWITLNKNKFFKKKDESVFVPKGSTHRIENFYKKPVKILEVQTGEILRETDIVRFKDIYGRTK